MAALNSHMTRMIGRAEIGGDPKIIIQCPTLDIFVARGQGITSDIQVTEAGIVVVQTSTDPETVFALHAHAAQVLEIAAWQRCIR